MKFPPSMWVWQSTWAHQELFFHIDMPKITKRKVIKKEFIGWRNRKLNVRLCKSL